MTSKKRVRANAGFTGIRGNGAASPEYRIWGGMLSRCNSITNQAYHKYGGRGITVDPSWSSFEQFFEDMGLKPKGMSLERKDNDLGYSKDNCIWATPREQANNRRSNKFVILDGDHISFAEAARRLNINPSTLQNKVTRKRMTHQEAIDSAR